MMEFAPISSLIGAGAFTFLCALLVRSQRASLIGRLLLIASMLSASWLLFLGLYYQSEFNISLRFVFTLEVLRHLGWFAFLSAILIGADSAPLRKLVFILGPIACVVSIIAIYVIYTRTISIGEFDEINLAKFTYVLFLLLPILGLLYVEQFYRNSHPDSRWEIKHLCIALTGLYAYDIYLFAEGVLFTRLSSESWAARGMINALAVPLIAL
ncbi:MAG: hypothetical protein ACU84Q_22050, partial [Gammaproteobacteria bacterium]